MNSRIKITLFLILYSFTLWAQQVRRVDISGAKALSRSRLLNTMGLKRRHPLPLSWPGESLENAVSLYYQQGYWLARIDSVNQEMTPDSQFVSLKIFITEGEPVRVNRISIIGMREEQRPFLMRQSRLKPGRIFYPDLLETDIESWLVWMENHGYPLCKIEIDTLLIRDDFSLDVSLNMNPGPPVFIQSLQLKGLDMTRPHVALRELPFSVGTLYRHDDVMSASAILRRRRLFQKVEEPVVFFSGDSAWVTLPVKEGNVNSLDGVVGYTPPKNDRETGYVTGRLEFNFRNLLGTGRVLDVYWEKKDRDSQAMRFGVTEPWVLGWPVHVGASFQQEIRDTTYLDRQWKGSVTYRPWSTWRCFVQGAVKSILPDSMGTVLYGLPESRTLILSAGLEYNTLDDLLNPRKGMRYATTFSWGSKRNKDVPESQKDLFPKNSSTRTLEVDAEIAWPLAKNVAYLSLHGREIKTDDAYVPVSDQIRFGGAKTLRGYSEDQFSADLAGWATVEYRFITGPNSRVFLFADAGIYQLKPAEGDPRRNTALGLGFGLRLETRVGILGVDYGLGRGDTMAQGKIHISVINRF